MRPESCAAFAHLRDAYAEGSLSALDQARLEAHLGQCEACRGEVLGTQALLLDLQLPPLTERERALSASLRNSVVPRAKAALFVRRRVGRAAALLAMAAALGALLFWPQRPRAARPEVARVLVQSPHPAGPAFAEEGDGLAEDVESSEPEDVMVPDTEADSTLSDVLAAEDTDLGVNLEDG
jgi:anti-sigma factor RsiW